MNMNFDMEHAVIVLLLIIIVVMLLRKRNRRPNYENFAIDDDRVDRFAKMQPNDSDNNGCSTCNYRYDQDQFSRCSFKEETFIDKLDTNMHKYVKALMRPF